MKKEKKKFLNIKFKRMNNTFTYTNFYSYDLIYLEYLKFIQFENIQYK